MVEISAIVQIVPGLPPQVGGVADYAVVLGNRLGEELGTTSRYVLAGWQRQWHVEPGLNAINVSGRRGRNELFESLTGVVDSHTLVVVHYVGYGYAKRGAPIALVKAIRDLRHAANGVRLITVFHELFAFGPPWTSSFWLSPIQRWVAGSLALFSDTAVVNRTASGQWLRRFTRCRTIYSPTFASVGEPSTSLEWNRRPRAAVVFGGGGIRERVYRRPLATLRRTFDSADIDQVWDIGPPIAVPKNVAGRSVVQLGSLPAHEVSARLAMARLGVVSYPIGFVTKSSVCAAYASHGVPMLVLDGGPRPSSYDGPPYIEAGPASPALYALQANEAFSWYATQAHSSLAVRRILSGARQASNPSNGAVPGTSRVVKILLVSRAFYPSIGGIEVMTAELAQAWSRRGHDVRVLTRTSLGRHRELQSIRVERHTNPLHALPLLDWSDVVVHNGFSLRALLPHALVPRRYLVIHQQTLPHPSQVGWVRSVAKKLMTRHGLQVGISKAVVSTLPRGAVQIPNAFRSCFRRNLPAVRSGLVFVGRLVSDKGADVLISALHELKMRRVQFTLDIFGDGPERPRLENHARTLGVAEMVRFQGWADEAVLQRAYACAEVIIGTVAVRAVRNRCSGGYRGGGDRRRVRCRWAAGRRWPSGPARRTG